MDGANMKIEQQMTRLLRRSQRIHLSTGAGEVYLERSAYGILCQLADEGPQRLGALAATFGLDPSTITRQVQSLERAGLVSRTTDHEDRRASILDLTNEGSEVLEHTRSYRRARLEQVLSHWADDERHALGELLHKLNESIQALVDQERDSP